MDFLLYTHRNLANESYGEIRFNHSDISFWNIYAQSKIFRYDSWVKFLVGVDNYLNKWWSLKFWSAYLSILMGCKNDCGLVIIIEFSTFNIVNR